ncbi:hypothetical protein ACHQM5_007497 [Ranunculus cassubicifolius]
MEFTDLEDRLDKTTYLTDVIGLLTDVKEYTNKKELTICNDRDEIIKIVLWNSTVPMFPTNLTTIHENVVVIVTTTQVKSLNDIIFLNGTKGTKIYVDPDIQRHPH